MKSHEYLEIPHAEVEKEVRLWKSRYKGREIKRLEKVAIEQRIFRDLVTEKGVCAKCPRKDNLTLDHIVPIRFLGDLGCDVTRTIVDGNYQLLCRPCNAFKSGRLDFSNAQTKVILLDLLSNL